MTVSRVSSRGYRLCSLHLLSYCRQWLGCLSSYWLALTVNNQPNHDLLSATNILLALSLLPEPPSNYTIIKPHYQQGLPDACRPMSVMPMPARLMLVLRTRFCSRELRLTCLPCTSHAQGATAAHKRKITTQNVTREAVGVIRHSCALMAAADTLHLLLRP